MPGHDEIAEVEVDDAETLPRPRTGLEEYERSGLDRPPFILTRAEVKLLGIAGVGFFLDAYDLFIINPVATMLQYRLYDGEAIPAGLQGFLKAAANIGSVIGQFLFGYLADALGRKAIYGKELMLIIFATILSLTTPTGSLSPNGAITYLAAARVLLGVGVGGDYPMSASVSADRAVVRRRGTLLAYVFASQGWGSLGGSLITLIVLLAYKGVMEGRGETSKVDGVWRVVVGLSLVPAFGTLYQRLTLPEAVKYEEAQGVEGLKKEGAVVAKGAPSGSEEWDDIEMDKRSGGSKKGDEEAPSIVVQDVDAKRTNSDVARRAVVQPKKRTHFREFLTYFSEWRHAKILIGTSMCWFLLDIAFYGINLNQNVVLQQIGFDGSSGSPWNRLFKISIGNVIITALGFVPGYYVSVLTIEYLGRKWIQIQGFLMAALFLAILASKFHTLSTAAFIVNFAFLQFFFNFGANTYCYPAEVFPTRFRAFAHGMSAASGKAGAIVSALAFNALSKKVGTPVVLWIFFGCCVAGAVFTLLLPEVKGRDPDAIDREEIRERAAKMAGAA
ncbi:inorganic phosphate transporter [Schizopora paradoxa]|uniref:Inorganic phosphate transporter n=1 Tax=Schizopora paradoxa TaxID=27342 RepID=A0A0H2RXD8_9AGAM|nr:inorganic phosphate transporter [Schizopora paradoxa]